MTSASLRPLLKMDTLSCFFFSSSLFFWCAAVNLYFKCSTTQERERGNKYNEMRFRRRFPGIVIDFTQSLFLYFLIIYILERFVMYYFIWRNKIHIFITLNCFTIEVIEMPSFPCPAPGRKPTSATRNTASAHILFIY